MRFINPFHKKEAIQIAESFNQYIDKANSEASDENAFYYFKQAKETLIKLKPFYDEGVINLIPDFDTLLQKIQGSIDFYLTPKETLIPCKFCENPTNKNELSLKGLCPNCEKNVSKIMPFLFREIGSEYKQLKLDPTRNFMVQISLVETMISQVNILLPYEEKGFMAFTPKIHEIMIDLTYRLNKLKNPPQNTFYCKQITYRHPIKTSRK